MLHSRFLSWIAWPLCVAATPCTKATVYCASLSMVGESRQTNCYTSFLQESLKVQHAASSRAAKIFQNSSRPAAGQATAPSAPIPSATQEYQQEDERSTRTTQQYKGLRGAGMLFLLQVVGICGVVIAMLTCCLVGLWDGGADSHVQAKGEQSVPSLSGLASIPVAGKPPSHQSPRRTTGQTPRRYSAPAFPGYIESSSSCNPHDVAAVDDQQLDPDVYGLVIATLCRDMHRLVQDDGYDTMALRVTRAFTSMSLLFFNIGLQLFLLSQIKYWVTDKAVIDIRAMYDDYEFHMYGKDQSHVRHTAGGVRGLAAYFDVGNFATLDSDLKSQVCFIPFSQPAFLGCILFIWTLTCAAEVKTGLNKANIFLRQLPTIQTMRTVFADEDEDQPNLRVIVGLTKEIKMILLFGVVIPRLFLTGWLLYLGSRWLAATPSFSDILLNAVALEFILLLKDLLYSVTAPARNKHDLSNTLIEKHVSNETAGFYTFLGTFMWIPICFAWVLFYIFYFQRVLPEYNWDVRGPCNDYIAAEHTFNAGR